MDAMSILIQRLANIPLQNSMPNFSLLKQLMYKVTPYTLSLWNASRRSANAVSIIDTCNGDEYSICFTERQKNIQRRAPGGAANKFTINYGRHDKAIIHAQ